MRYSPPVTAGFRAREAGFGLYLVVVNLLVRLPGHALRLFVLRRLGQWTIGPGTTIERGVRVLARGGVTIGARCLINADVTLDGRGGLTIGDLVNISPEAMCLTADHDPDDEGFAGRYRPVSVGSRCWIATRAIVLPGSVVGDGVVVGAGSVVSGTVDGWGIVSGAPAERVRERKPEAQATLPRVRRWFH